MLRSQSAGQGRSAGEQISLGSLVPRARAQRRNSSCTAAMAASLRRALDPETVQGGEGPHPVTLRLEGHEDRCLLPAEQQAGLVPDHRGKPTPGGKDLNTTTPARSWDRACHAASALGLVLNRAGTSARRRLRSLPRRAPGALQIVLPPARLESGARATPGPTRVRPPYRAARLRQPRASGRRVLKAVVQAGFFAPTTLTHSRWHPALRGAFRLEELAGVSVGRGSPVSPGVRARSSA